MHLICSNFVRKSDRFFANFCPGVQGFAVVNMAPDGFFFAL